MTTTLTRSVTTSRPPRMGAGHRRRPSLGRVLAWVAMILVIVVTLFPFYWILRTALSSNTAINSDPTSLLPVGFSLGGFERVFGLQSTEEALAQGAPAPR